MKFTISKKIGLGFSIIILFVIFNGYFSVLTLNNSRAIEKHKSQVVEPLLKKLTELSLLITRTKMQTINWVHFPNPEDKIKLEGISFIEYPLLQEELKSLSGNWKDNSVTLALDSIYLKIDNLFASSNDIIMSLQGIEDYNDPMLFFTASSTLDDQIQPISNEVLFANEKLISAVDDSSKKAQEKMLTSFKLLERVLFISFLVLVFIAIISLYFTSKSITKPVYRLREILKKIGRGELPAAINSKSTDEIREMEVEVNKVVQSLQQNVQFAKKIGSGEFDLPYEKLSDNDVLGEALIEMKSNLQSTSKFAEGLGKGDYNSYYTLKGENDQLGTSLINMKVGLLEAKDALEKSHAEIKEHNKSMTDSINYAKNIQQSIVPSHKHLKELFPDSLMFYKTKDQVSGDIPWIFKKEDYVYAAAIDCTGHGVPGALLSIVAHFVLAKIMSSQKSNFTPAEILYKLHDGVVKALNKNSDSKIDDGMDVAIIRFNKNKKELVFAGANRPLFQLRNNEVLVTKGDRRPIGGLDYENEEFQNHTIELQPNDSVYIFSDGYPDQFGGPKDKKFMVSRMKKLFISNKDKSMPEIEKEISTAFFDWKGKTEQTDDVIIIGVRF